MSVYQNITNWIDFESEISRVIQIIEHTMDNTGNRPLSMEDNVRGTQSTLSIFEEYLDPYSFQYPMAKTENYEIIEYDLTYRAFRDMLKNDLDQFTFGFDQYLNDYVEKMDIDTNHPSIQYLLKVLSKSTTSHIICFNYTNTLERLLNGAETDICYIHGKVNGSTKSAT